MEEGTFLAAPTLSSRHFAHRAFWYSEIRLRPPPLGWVESPPWLRQRPFDIAIAAQGRGGLRDIAAQRTRLSLSSPRSSSVRTSSSSMSGNSRMSSRLNAGLIFRRLGMAAGLQLMSRLEGGLNSS